MFPSFIVKIGQDFAVSFTIVSDGFTDTVLYDVVKMRMIVLVVLMTFVTITFGHSNHFLCLRTRAGETLSRPSVAYFGMLPMGLFKLRS